MRKELPRLNPQTSIDATPHISDDRLPFITPIDEETYGIKKKGYQIGNSQNYISGGYKKYMDNVNPFLQFHSDSAEIGDFNKKIKIPLGAILINGDEENKNINVNYGLDRPFNKIPNATYELYTLYNALKGATSQFDQYRPKDVFDVFPLFPKVWK